MSKFTFNLLDIYKSALPQDGLMLPYYVEPGDFFYELALKHFYWIHSVVTQT